MLLWEANTGCVAGVEMALAAGAKVWVRNKKGNSALHCSVFGGNPEVTSILIDAGAKVRTASGDFQFFFFF